MKNRKLSVLSLTKLKENLHYDPETGVFTRIKGNGRNVNIGDIAGSNRSGYVLIWVNNSPYQAHRLAWLYMMGVMPIEFIDHINGDRSDNRFGNLREATHQQNRQNITKPQSNNTTGFLGVTYKTENEKYVASIRVDKKLKHLGYFTTPEEAHQAYLIAKRKFHPFGTI